MDTEFIDAILQPIPAPIFYISEQLNRNVFLVHVPQQASVLVHIYFIYFILEFFKEGSPSAEAVFQGALR